MVEIINQGGAQDRQSIGLYTSKNTPIPNVRTPERPYESMLAAKKIATGGHTRREMRSLSASYNCVGMVFASRRTSIDAEHVPMILRDDGYVEVKDVAKVMTGDVIVYFHASGDVLHVGLVVSNQTIFESSTSMRQIRILSQFGNDGEYFHDHTDVPAAYGNAWKFYSERRGGDESWPSLIS